MAADAAELVDARAGADVHVVFDIDVAAERRHVAEDGVVADVAVVRHVHVGHEDVVIADARDAAAARGAAVHGDELAKDVAGADRQPGVLAVELEILRNLADRRERVDLAVVAELGSAVDHRRGADAAVRAGAHQRPDDRVGADRRAAADLRARVDDRRRVDLRLVGDEAEQQLGFRDHLVADDRRRLRACERGPPRPERDLEPELIAREHLAAELRVVDAAQVDARVGRGVLAMQQKHRRHLRQRLEHHHAGQHRRPREVSLKKLFVDGDVLDRDQPSPRLVLGNRVDETGRLPVAETVEENGNVQHGSDNANCKMLIAELIQQFALCN